MIIDYQDLTPEALKGVAEQFIISQLSETEEQPQMSDWISRVIDKIKMGELVIEFSLADESITLKNPSEIQTTEKEAIL